MLQKLSITDMEQVSEQAVFDDLKNSLIVRSYRKYQSKIIIKSASAMFFIPKNTGLPYYI